MQIEYKNREEKIEDLMMCLAQMEEGRAVLRPLAEQKLQEAIDSGQLKSIILDGEECFVSKLHGALDVVVILRKGPATIEELASALEVDDFTIKLLIEFSNHGSNALDRMFEKTQDGRYVLINDPEFEEM